MNLTSALGPDALGYKAAPGFEPQRCLTPSYAQQHDVDCFEMFRRLPTFTFYVYKLDLAANVFFLAFFSLSFFDGRPFFAPAAALCACFEVPACGPRSRALTPSGTKTSRGSARGLYGQREECGRI